jgi:hypothetical protein
MNVQMRVHILRTFVTHLLVHMHQIRKIALEIATKITSVNGPLIMVKGLVSGSCIAGFCYCLHFTQIQQIAIKNIPCLAHF